MSTSVQRPLGPAAGRVRLPLAVLVVVATLVVALLAVWATAALGVDHLPTAAPRDPPAPPPQATTFTVGPDGEVSFQEFSATLAGPPYACGTAEPLTGFTAFVGCEHVVHADYDAAGHDWTASTGVLLVGDQLVTAGDPRATTKAVFDALVEQLYTSADHPRVMKVTEDGAQLPEVVDPSASRLANVTVRRTGLETPYDRFVVVVVQLDSGRDVAFFSAFPHDADQAALKALVASVGSLSTRR